MMGPWSAPLASQTQPRQTDQHLAPPTHEAEANSPPPGGSEVPPRAPAADSFPVQEAGPTKKSEWAAYKCPNPQCGFESTKKPAFNRHVKACTKGPNPGPGRGGGRDGCGRPRKSSIHGTQKESVLVICNKQKLPKKPTRNSEGTCLCASHWERVSTGKESAVTTMIGSESQGGTS